MTRVNTIAGLMTGLREIHEDVRTAALLVDPAHPVRVYRWRPRGRIELPAIYPVFEPSSMEPIDTISDIDYFTLAVRLVVRFTDEEEEMDRLVAIADVYRSVVDTALKNNDGPLGGARVDRKGIRPTVDDFNDLLVRGLEFPIRAELEAANQPQL